MHKSQDTRSPMRTIRNKVAWFYKHDFGHLTPRDFRMWSYLLNVTMIVDKFIVHRNSLFVCKEGAYCRISIWYVVCKWYYYDNKLKTNRFEVSMHTFIHRCIDDGIAFDAGIILPPICFAASHIIFGSVIVIVIAGVRHPLRRWEHIGGKNI